MNGNEKRRERNRFVLFILPFALAISMLFALTGIVYADDGDSSVATLGCLTFTSEDAFSLAVNDTSKIYWEGKVEYSTDATAESPTWTEWDGNAITAVCADSNEPYRIYLRGSGNKHFSAIPPDNPETYKNENYNNLMITSEKNVTCDGNIETLLDYEKVLKGEHPTMSSWCFFSLFRGCTTLTSGPELPATVLSDYCYRAMFYGCSGLTEVPELPAMNLKTGCYRAMFSRCASLAKAPKLPATTMADSCYTSMFTGCAIETAPELPATNLAYDCYLWMFDECTNLKEAPELPATELAEGCYEMMFYNCSNLETAPELPATVMKSCCYRSMFSGCTALKEAPELPATELAGGCYNYMFSRCIRLQKAPKLPATNLEDSCYEFMFSGCVSLTSAPALPATVMTNDCYAHMFVSCTSLTTVPALPATTLAEGCYAYMFSKCSSLKVSDTKTNEYTYAWTIPNIGSIETEEENWNNIMLNETGGTFTGDPSINTTYYVENEPVKPSIASAKLSKTNYSFTGKTITPTVIVTNLAGDTLTEGKDYTVTAKGKNVGVQKATIKGVGNYSGTINLNYNIIPVKTSITKLTKARKAFTVKWTKKSTQVTGYQIQYSTNSNFTKSTTKAVTVKSYKTTSKKISKLKAKKKYYVRVRTYKTVSGKNYYSEWSATKNVKTK